MTNEAYPCEACYWAELLNIVLNFLGQSDTHLKYVTFSLLLITLTTEKDSIWMQNGQIILQKPHIDRIALETMLQHEKVDADVVIDQVESLHFILRRDLLLCHFVASFNLLNEPGVLILDIALFKNNGCDLVLRGQSIILGGTVSASLGVLVTLSGLTGAPILRLIALILILLSLVLGVLNLSNIEDTNTVILVVVFGCTLCIRKLFMGFSNIFL